MKVTPTACLFFALVAHASWAQDAKQEPYKVGPPTGNEKIVSPDARLELLFTRSAPIEGGLTEGPAVSPDGVIFFSDIPSGEDAGKIMRFDPATKETTVFAEDSHKSNGLIFNRDGELLAAEGADYGGRGVAKWNVQTGERTVLADRFVGQRFNSCNDLCLDAEGRIYFTDPRYVGHEPRELQSRSVYRIDLNGRVALATDDVVKPNGIAISPDGKKLYVADHDNGTDRIDPDGPQPEQGVMRIYAFDRNDQGGVSNRQVLVDFGDKKGCDGMCVDRRGNVYLTTRDPSRPGVMIVNPKGREVAFIPTGPENQTGDPVGLPSNVEFGVGAEAKTLYITVDKSLYRIAMNVAGYHHQYQGEGKVDKKAE